MSAPNRVDAPAFPALEQFAITKSDVTVFDPVTRGIYVGTGGTLVVSDAYGTEATYVNVPDGTALPIACRQVKAATTASNLVGWR